MLAAIVAVDAPITVSEPALGTEMVIAAAEPTVGDAHAGGTAAFRFNSPTVAEELAEEEVKAAAAAHWALKQELSEAHQLFKDNAAKKKAAAPAKSAQLPQTTGLEEARTVELPAPVAVVASVAPHRTPQQLNAEEQNKRRRLEKLEGRKPPPDKEPKLQKRKVSSDAGPPPKRIFGAVGEWFAKKQEAAAEGESSRAVQRRLGSKTKPADAKLLGYPELARTD